MIARPPSGVPRKWPSPCVGRNQKTFMVGCTVTVDDTAIRSQGCAGQPGLKPADDGALQYTHAGGDERRLAGAGAQAPASSAAWAFRSPANRRCRKTHVIADYWRV